MAIAPETRTKIEAELAMGRTPKDLESKYGIPYVTIQGWKKKLQKATEGTTDLSAVVEVDLETLHTVAEAVKELAPPEVIKKVDKLVEGVTSLQTLEPKFHAVVLALLNRAEKLAKDEDLSVKDWSMLSAGMGSLYANLFNKSGVNVNVLNQTSVNNEKLSMFKGSMRSV